MFRAAGPRIATFFQQTIQDMLWGIPVLAFDFRFLQGSLWVNMPWEIYPRTSAGASGNDKKSVATLAGVSGGLVGPKGQDGGEEAQPGAEPEPTQPSKEEEEEEDQLCGEKVEKIDSNEVDIVLRDDLRTYMCDLEKVWLYGRLDANGNATSLIYAENYQG